jgi:hypothetical protein
MLDAGRSTERLNSAEDGGVTEKKKGGIRPICKLLAPFE